MSLLIHELNQDRQPIMSAIPIILMEEHNEAFLLWNLAVRKRLIGESGNVLLHVDEHADLRKAERPIDAAIEKMSIKEIVSTTYRQIDIGGFIWPSLCQGLFDRVCWMRWQHDPNMKSSSISFNQQMDLNTQPENAAFAQSIRLNLVVRTCHFIPISVNHVFTESGSLVMDIDLDFFLCDAKANTFDIEITKKEYESWRGNRYHKIRLFMNGRATFVKKDSCYYLRFSPQIGMSKTKRKPRVEITERIEALCRFLNVNQIRPKLIGICRSRFSGFMPFNHMNFAEERLLNSLRSLYDIDVCSIADFKRRVSSL